MRGVDGRGTGQWRAIILTAPATNQRATTAMTMPLRILLSALTLIALLAAGAATWLLLVVDPNDFKPRIVDSARRQGVALDIRGELTWRLLPKLGVRIGRTGIRADDDRVPEVDFEALTLSMAWLPLLRGELRLDAVELQGADIRIRSTEQAALVAAAPIAAAPAATAAPAPAAEGLVVAVRSVTVRDARVVLERPAGARVLEHLQLAGRDLILDGTPFPIELEFDYRDPGMPLPIAVVLTAELGVDRQKSRIDARDVQLKLAPEQRPAIEGRFRLQLDGSGETLDITDLELHSAGLDARGELRIAQLRSEPQAMGRLELPAADPRPLLHGWQLPLPPFAAADALSRLGLSTGFEASAQDLRLDQLQLQLDDTRVTGALTARLAAPRALHASLHGDRLDLGRYRGADAKSAGAAPGTALLAPLAGPLAFLQGGSGDLALDWDQLTLDRLRLETLRLRARFAGDGVHVEDLSARTLGGSASLRGALDGLTGGDPSLRFESRAEHIVLAEVRRALAPQLALDGTLELTMAGSARGADAERLQQSLAAQGSFEIADPILAGTNIEQTFCDLVTTVERTEKRNDWPNHSRFDTIAGSLRLAGANVILENLTTGMGNLRLHAAGTLDRATQHYEVLASVRLDGDRTSAEGCTVRSGRLRGRDIPLRCSGTLGKQSRMLCAPDPQFVAGLAGDRALEELRERGKLEGKRGKAVEGLLKGLLNRDRNGD